MTLLRREARALGSPLRLLVVASATALEDRACRADLECRVDAAWAAARLEFAAVDSAMSRFREDSEITLLHRRHEAGQAPAPVSSRLRAALVLADRAARATQGAFDARVVVDLERLGFGGVRQAWPGAGSSARRPAPGRCVVLDRRQGTAALPAPVDLGGIGKGLALRWASRRVAGILGRTGFLLDAGGDIASRGSVSAAAWSVGIEDPSGAEAPLATCVLDVGGAIATSSIRRAAWLDDQGRRVHHLIDPRTGEPGGGGLVAVTVAAPDPAWAEIWSKALFLEGPARIGDVARGRGLAAWWVDSTGALSMTAAGRRRTTWVRGEVGLVAAEELLSPPEAPPARQPATPAPATG